MAVFNEILLVQTNSLQVAWTRAFSVQVVNYVCMRVYIAAMSVHISKLPTSPRGDDFHAKKSRPWGCLVCQYVSMAGKFAFPHSPLKIIKVCPLLGATNFVRGHSFITQVANAS